jgi:hypothetical protein
MFRRSTSGSVSPDNISWTFSTGTYSPVRAAVGGMVPAYGIAHGIDTGNPIECSASRRRYTTLPKHRALTTDRWLAVAMIIPGLNSTATSGERRFAHRLESLLEDDYLCWFNVPFGRRNRHPDFVLLHPRRGLLVVEVKDWKLDTIRSISPTSVTLLTPTGLKEVRHPTKSDSGICSPCASIPC